ncbi:MAG: cynT [Verrucomicrobiales bacterium]|nr:cynT [Verrucomicrobiales bacterium]
MPLRQLFENNRQWSQQITAEDPRFFEKLSKQQSPQYLWIGCADSRVPANEIVGMLPGELFVHRNVANVVVHSDLNCLSVMQYAVDVLKVKHIIVCGHYGCGGVQAALRDQRLGLIDNWLRHVQDVIHKYPKLISTCGTETEAVNRACELNVIDQVVNVAQTTIVQAAWDRGQNVTIHGWIYGLQNGLLKDLKATVNDPNKLKEAQGRALEGLTELK